MNQFTLAAFSAERRIAAVTLFRGTQLEDTLLRHLPLDTTKATGSVRELVTRALEHHRPQFVAISSPASKAGDRIRAFCKAVKEIANDLDRTLMCSYGYPPLTRKEHVRRAGRIIWPGLDEAKSKRAAVDAAVTGLYVQTERLFSIHSEQS